MGPRTHTVCVGHTAKTHLDSANADARPSREATPGAAATPPGGPADRAPFKVACSGESAPPGSPPGVPGPRLATNVTSPQSTALDRGAPLTSPQSTALDLAPRFERLKKKSIPASRFNLPTRHPALGRKIPRPLTIVATF